MRCKGKSFKFFSFLIRFVISGIYPFLCIRILDFAGRTDSIVTFYARLLTFVFNWVLIVCIFINESFNSDHHRQSFIQMKTFFRKLIKLQTNKENFVLLVRCTLKLLVILEGLLHTGYNKYMFNVRRDMPIWEKRFSVIVILLPFVIMALASNRIFVANTTIKLLLIQLMVNSKAKDQKLKIELLSVNYANLHSFFHQFNRLNAVNLIVVIGFCILNIIYQV